ncbi:hypothetical protein GPECTOR_43g902 [Gonium pectorale]|uniref:Uncharacterized protein n=1 Tax=Gonium pectorale TaxID=33097 RepID=A0A150G9D6_GONPE|nr:hypothetical protein GPECTOR_43g902 [Gonium pectorale]|eukprot:KXZ46466.1 hypothetical protein GPECTOR_43g902 [Gonium pectorale]
MLRECLAAKGQLEEELRAVRAHAQQLRAAGPTATLPHAAVAPAVAEPEERVATTCRGPSQGNEGEQDESELGTLRKEEEEARLAAALREQAEGFAAELRAVEAQAEERRIEELRALQEEVEARSAVELRALRERAVLHAAELRAAKEQAEERAEARLQAVQAQAEAHAAGLQAALERAEEQLRAARADADAHADALKVFQEQAASEAARHAAELQAVQADAEERLYAGACDPGDSSPAPLQPGAGGGSGKEAPGLLIARLRRLLAAAEAEERDRLVLAQRQQEQELELELPPSSQPRMDQLPEQLLAQPVVSSTRRQESAQAAEQDSSGGGGGGGGVGAAEAPCVGGMACGINGAATGGSFPDSATSDSAATDAGAEGGSSSSGVGLYIKMHGMDLLDSYPLVFPYPCAPPPGWAVHEGLLFAANMTPGQDLEEAMLSYDVHENKRLEFAAYFLAQVASMYFVEKGVPKAVPHSARKAVARQWHNVVSRGRARQDR